MWYALITFIYIGANPNMAQDPGTVEYSVLTRGYPSLEICYERIWMDLDMLQMRDSKIRNQDEYVAAVSCFESHPRVAKYTKYGWDEK